jgi:Leucine-rich repeat (LRR) protein
MYLEKMYVPSASSFPFPFLFPFPFPLTNPVLLYIHFSFLEKNRIERLEGLERCTRLQELHLSNQTTSHFSFCMESLKTLAMSLRVLNLSNCHIANIEPLLVLKCIEQMDLSKNNIDQVEQVYGLVGGLSTLKELDLTGNPVTQLPKYRENTIIFSTTRLGNLTSYFIYLLYVLNLPILR